MRTKMLAACMLAAITLCLLSCGWFTKDNKVTLTGKWRVTAIIDSSAEGLKGNSFFSGFNADSTKAVVNFNADSSLVFTTAKDNDTSKSVFHTDADFHFIYVKDDKASKADSFAVAYVNDTLLNVVKDSLHITLKRLK